MNLRFAKVLYNIVYFSALTLLHYSNIPIQKEDTGCDRCSPAGRLNGRDWHCKRWHWIGEFLTVPGTVPTIHTPLHPARIDDKFTENGWCNMSTNTSTWQHGRCVTFLRNSLIYFWAKHTDLYIINKWPTIAINSCLSKAAHYFPHSSPGPRISLRHSRSQYMIGGGLYSLAALTGPKLLIYCIILSEHSVCMGLTLRFHLLSWISPSLHWLYLANLHFNEQTTQV